MYHLFIFNEMKKIFFVLSILSSINLFAQDVIVKHNGGTIISKVIEIKDSEVKYKKYNNPNGPTYSIALSEINQINYENGEKDIFSANNEAKSSRELLILDIEFNNLHKKIKRLKQTAWIAGAALAVVGGVLIEKGTNPDSKNETQTMTGGVILAGGVVLTTSLLIKANSLKKEYNLQAISLWHKEFELSNRKTLMAGVDLINDQLSKKSNLGFGLRMNF